MARFLKIPATSTGGIAPWSLGVTGFSNRWDATLLTDPAGTNVLTLPDDIGTLDLTAPNTNTRTLTDTGVFKYIAFPAGSSVGLQRIPAETGGFTDGFTVAIVAKITTGNAVFAKIGGYAFEFGGNGKINCYNYAATTQTVNTATSGTGWHIIVASFNGASTKLTVDGTVYTPATFAAPTTYQNMYFGGGTNAIDGVLMATHPTVLSDADRLTVHNTIKTRLGI